FVYHVAAGGVDASTSCQLIDSSLSTGTVNGAPAIIEDGTVERAFVADSGLARMWAFGAVPGTGCVSTYLGNPGASPWTAPNPPTTDGSVVYAGHNVSALSKVSFASNVFGTPIDAPTFVVPIFGPVAIADAVYFGDTNGVAHLYSYTAAFAASANWTEGVS